MTTTLHPSPKVSATQSAKILARLRNAKGSFVPMPTLVACSGSYVVATRISELRSRGCVIDNKKTWDVFGTVHSFYRLVSGGGK